MKFETIKRINDTIRLIDQTKLPGELVYHDIDNHHELIEAIRRLEVRGAPAIGIAAAYGLAVAVVASGAWLNLSAPQAPARPARAPAQAAAQAPAQVI